MTHVAVHREREGEVLQEGEVVAHVPVDRRLCGALVDAVFVVVNGCAVGLVVLGAYVDHLRVTGLLVHLGSLFGLVGLPDAVGLPVPDLTDRLVDEPAVAGVVHLLAILVVLVVEVLDSVLIIREAECGVPLEVLGVDVAGVQRDFDTGVGHLTQVGGDAAEASEVRQALAHNHVVRALVVEVNATGDATGKNREVNTEVPRRGLLPLQVVVTQTADAQGIEHFLLGTASQIVGIETTVGQVRESQISVAERTVTVGTVAEAQLGHIEPLPVLCEFLLREHPAGTQ